MPSRRYNYRMDVSAITGYFSLLSADWIILGGLALFLTFDAIRAGSARAIAIAIALPLAFLLSESIPSAAFIGTFIAQSVPAVQTGAFIVLTIGLFVAFYRIIDTGYDSPHVIPAAMAGVGSAIVCVLVLLQLPANTLPWDFGASFSYIFGESYRLFWFVGAYFALAISRG